MLFLFFNTPYKITVDVMLFIVLSPISHKVFLRLRTDTGWFGTISLSINRSLLFLDGSSRYGNQTIQSRQLFMFEIKRIGVRTSQLKAFAKSPSIWVCLQQLHC